MNKINAFIFAAFFVQTAAFAQIDINNLENNVQKVEQKVNTNLQNNNIQNTDIQNFENKMHSAEQKLNTNLPNGSTTTTTTTTTTNTNTSTTSGNPGTVSLSSLSQTDIVGGLKEALAAGSTKASQALNQVNGYYTNPKVKIPFPEDAQRVATELRNLGFGSKVDDFEKTLNHAAENAAIEAAPIFKSAITSMTINDAKNILTGPDTAATGYLRKTTYNSLFATFTPHIKKALDNTLATKKWTDIATLYNKLPTTTKKVNTDLVSFTTGKALKGLFMLVAEEEAKIRKDPVARTTDLLKKVFGAK